MTSTDYTVPDDPADPEAAALELIVRLPQDIESPPAEMVALLHEITAGSQTAGLPMELQGCLTDDFAQFWTRPVVGNIPSTGRPP